MARNRIRESDLAALVAELNSETGNAERAYDRRESDGRYVANIGTYVLDYAYGGVALTQLVSEGGGCRTIIDRGTRRECYDQIRSLLEGVRIGKEVA